MAAQNQNIDLNSNPNRELLFMITKFLEIKNLTETARTLERESGFYFNMRYFEDLVHNGAFDQAEEYVDGFTDVHENSFSTKIYYELRRQKFLEILEEGERCKALAMLMHEFRDFAPYNRSLCGQAAALLTVDDFRTYQIRTGHGEINEARRLAMDEIRRCIHVNPAFNGKLDCQILYPPCNVPLCLPTQGTSSRMKLVEMVILLHLIINGFSSSGRN